MPTHAIPTKVRDSDCGFSRREIKRHIHRHERRAAVREIDAQRAPDAQLCKCGADCYECETGISYEPPGGGRPRSNGSSAETCWEIPGE